MLRNSSNEEKCKYLLENGKYDSVKIIKYIKKNQLVEIDGGLFYLTSATELVNAYQLLLDNRYYKIIFEINKSIIQNNYCYFEERGEILIDLYKMLCEKMANYYPKYGGIYESLLSKINDFELLNKELKCKTIVEILKILKSGPINGNLKFEPFNMASRSGRLSKQSVQLDKTYFYDVSITGIYSKKYKL